MYLDLICRSSLTLFFLIYFCKCMFNCVMWYLEVYILVEMSVWLDRTTAKQWVLALRSATSAQIVCDSFDSTLGKFPSVLDTTLSKG